MTASNVANDNGPRIRVYVATQDNAPCIRVELVTNYNGCQDFKAFLKNKRFSEMDIEHEPHDGRIDQHNFFPRTGEGAKALVAALQETKLENAPVTLIDKNENLLDVNSLSASYDKRITANAIAASRQSERH